MKFSIESHFVGVHGPYELHRKEKQIECTAHFVGVHEPYESHRKEKQIFMHRVSGAWKFAFLSDAIHIAREHRQKCNSILIFTSFYNKVFRGIAYFNTKMSYLSDFKSTKSKILVQPAPDVWRTEKNRRIIQCKYEQKIDILKVWFS